ncbi:hypothetical protein [Tautonia plasticadhaerens]|uniref:Uncharacterized protein n=1 Tax=Tautonia plasticadhaerens TaxID=2527974 RepID=A0A518H393_9BACT|nr:hypothetical protein [Tautonia plasticadhaerens]QDV35316.1 hypothetical protein ElP_32190 [Tautonia plasticadhaerens]
MSEHTNEGLQGETVQDQVADAAGDVRKVAALIWDANDNKLVRTKKYNAGKAMIASLAKRKASLRKKDGNGNVVDHFTKDDFDQFMNEVKLELRLTTPLKDPRPDVYVRYYVFIDLAREVAGDKATDLSFFVVVNKLFATMIEFDKAGLTAELRARWAVPFGEAVRGLTGENPMSQRDLEALLQAHKDMLAAEAASRQTPEALAEAEQRKQRREAAKAEAKVRESIAGGIDAALGDNLLNPAEVMQLVEKAAAARKVKLPNVGADPSRLTPDEARAFAAAMNAAKNYVAVR